ncbi:hypothetical protein GCM10010277_10520 [Streptomyces longisporoflavus]|nr:hypothetical protein GCM10010277_10520 [Streptomyces longisporoflavus]
MLLTCTAGDSPSSAILRARLAEGHQAVRIQSGIPGLKAVYGVHSTDESGAAVLHQQARPLVEDWDTDAYLRHAHTVFEAVRPELGAELPLLHDAHHRLSPIQAAGLGKDLEPYRPFWLEDCTPAENQEALRLVRGPDHRAVDRLRGCPLRVCSVSGSQITMTRRPRV